MTKSDLSQIIGFLEEYEPEFAAYLSKGTGGSQITRASAQREAGNIIQRAQDFNLDSEWADYLTQEGQ